MTFESTTSLALVHKKIDLAWFQLKDTNEIKISLYPIHRLHRTNIVSLAIGVKQYNSPPLYPPQTKWLGQPANHYEGVLTYKTWYLFIFQFQQV